MDQMFIGDRTGAGPGSFCKMQTGLLVSFCKLLLHTAKYFGFPTTLANWKRQPHSSEWKRCSLANGISSKWGQKEIKFSKENKFHQLRQ